MMEKLSVDDLPISDYNKIYLKKHLKSLTYSVNLAFQILESGIKKSTRPLEEITMAEIGGGTGIISLLAKWYGINKVIYSDTYKQSCIDFDVISTALGLKPDDIILGSIEELAKKYSHQVHMIVSRDVIEHIYDPQQFFKQSIENFNEVILVHNTSANIYNIFKKNYFKKIHKMDETTGNPDQFKPGDSVESHYSLRYKFIHSNFSKLPEKFIEQLARLTRGKNYHDIYSDVKTFIESGKMPQPLPHPTNTCDPATGNWTEHLLTFEQYESFLIKYSYKTEWHFALYDEWRNTDIKKIVLKILNGFIKNLGGLARFVSPAVIMVSAPERKLTINH